MKKFQKIGTNNVKCCEFSSSNKPKPDIFTLLPQILKILPKFNFGNFFSTNAPEEAPKNEQPTNLMQNENYKTLASSMEQHRQKIREIKEKEQTIEKQGTTIKM